MFKYNLRIKNILNKYLVVVAYFFIMSNIVLNVSEPSYDYDLIGYIASAKLIENKDKTILFNETINELKKNLPSEVYNSWFSKKSLMTDEKSLIEHLPFYQIRKGYTYGIYVLTLFGLSMTKASYYLPNIFILLSVLLFAYFNLKHVRSPYNIISPFILLVLGMNLVSRITTPDAMLYFSCVLCSILYLENKNNTLLAVIPFTILIKTDLIIYSMLIYSFLFFFKKTSKIKIMSSFIFTTLIYFYTNISSLNYGYAKLFYYTFIDRIKYPASIEYSYSILDHFFVLKSRINQIFINYNSWSSSLFLFMLILFILISFDLINKKNNRELFNLFIKNPYYSLIYINYFYIFIHFLLFPRPDIRFFSSNYALIIFSLFSLFENTVLLEKKSTR